MAAKTGTHTFHDTQQALGTARDAIPDLDRVEAELGHGAVRFQMGTGGLSALFKAKSKEAE